jgi:hypothetical protein
LLSSTVYYITVDIDSTIVTTKTKFRSVTMAIGQD